MSSPGESAGTVPWSCPSLSPGDSSALHSLQACPSTAQILHPQHICIPKQAVAGLQPNSWVLGGCQCFQRPDFAPLLGTARHPGQPHRCPPCTAISSAAGGTPRQPREPQSAPKAVEPGTGCFLLLIPVSFTFLPLQVDTQKLPAFLQTQIKIFIPLVPSKRT